MRPLQLGLLVMGAALLLLMLLNYVWLRHKSQPSASLQPPPEPPPPLQEPTLDTPADAAGFILPVPEKKPGLDGLIDAIVPIALETPVTGDAVLAALPPTWRIGRKPFAIEGLNTTHAQWEFAVAGQRYSQLQAGVQLANRIGAINDIEFSEFVMKTQTFCDALGGTPDFPDMRSEISRARELDQFAHAHDAQLGLVLRTRRTAWSPSYVMQMAAKWGFMAGPMAGRMVLPASLAGQPPVLLLAFDAQAAMAEDPTLAALREVSLSLDVTQVNRSENAFVRMREIGTRMAQAMEGIISDNNGLALGDPDMDVIGAEIERIYDTLAQRGIAAGSVLAWRLFS